jgi:hypothetical protein
MLHRDMTGITLASGNVVLFLILRKKTYPLSSCEQTTFSETTTIVLRW